MGDSALHFSQFYMCCTGVVCSSLCKGLIYHEKQLSDLQKMVEENPRLSLGTSEELPASHSELRFPILLFFRGKLSKCVNTCF